MMLLRSLNFCHNFKYVAIGHVLLNIKVTLFWPGQFERVQTLIFCDVMAPHSHEDTFSLILTDLQTIQQIITFKLYLSESERQLLYSCTITIDITKPSQSPPGGSSTPKPLPLHYFKSTPPTNYF